jgi:hypothetical protein
MTAARSGRQRTALIAAVVLVALAAAARALGLRQSTSFVEGSMEGSQSQPLGHHHDVHGDHSGKEAQEQTIEPRQTRSHPEFTP